MPTLNWIGKEAVVNHHHEVPFHLLKDVPDLACGQPGDGNLIVQGDNLVALKALLPYYAGQVKCIYIDPPYNTGNEGWAYNDNVNSPIIREWLDKVVGKEGETLDRHDRWLCMMYPRLALLRQFLREDGVMLVSMGDSEISNLRILLDDILGRENFIAQLVWEKGRKNDAKLFSVGHEYIVVYGRSISRLRQENTVWREEKPGAKEIHDEYLRLKSIHGKGLGAIETGLREFYKMLPKGHPSKKHSRYGNVDDGGVWRDDNMSWPGGGGPRYDVIHPVTGKPCAVPDGGWRYATLAKMKEMIFKGVVVFRETEKEPPIRKTYLVRGNDTEDIDENDIGRQVMGSCFYRSALQASNTLQALFGLKLFENPKDHEILSRLIRYVTSDDQDSIMLDSFAGSGTTGHAVLSLNKQDGGHRRFILVEMEPKIARDITAERVRRVAEGYKNVKGEKVDGLGGSFRYCELGEPLFDESGKIREAVSFADLARHVYFTETGEPLSRERVTKSPFIGECRGVGIYLLFNGILGDKSAQGGNVLTRSALAKLPTFDGQKVIYCAGCLLGKDRLQAERILVRQTPYEIKLS
ncbi:MAG: site-specific DNA-methyltransferase [Nitrospirota bacterium]|nr:site-specific DNA-methyltransferase [Nitrospirota bacterium]